MTRGALTSYNAIFKARVNIRTAVATGRMPKTGTITTTQKRDPLLDRCWSSEKLTDFGYIYREEYPGVALSHTGSFSCKSPFTNLQPGVSYYSFSCIFIL
jgi:hypothetical protein